MCVGGGGNACVWVGVCMCDVHYMGGETCLYARVPCVQYSVYIYVCMLCMCGMGVETLKASRLHM